MLSLVLSFTSLTVSCPEKPEEKEDDGPETIAKEYQGKFERGTPTSMNYITLTKNKFIISVKDAPDPEQIDWTFSAWTIENELWAKVPKYYLLEDGQTLVDNYFGVFTDVDSLEITWASGKKSI
jgi:hypothetical protein